MNLWWYDVRQEIAIIFIEQIKIDNNTYELFKQGWADPWHFGSCKKFLPDIPI